MARSGLAVLLKMPDALLASPVSTQRAPEPILEKDKLCTQQFAPRFTGGPMAAQST
jgi:hypothetical protein